MEQKQQHEYQDRHWIVGKIKELEKRFGIGNDSAVIDGLSQEINWIKEQLKATQDKVAELEKSLANTEVVEGVILTDKEV